MQNMICMYFATTFSKILTKFKLLNYIKLTLSFNYPQNKLNQNLFRFGLNPKKNFNSNYN